MPNTRALHHGQVVAVTAVTTSTTLHSTVGHTAAQVVADGLGPCPRTWDRGSLYIAQGDGQVRQADVRGACDRGGRHAAGPYLRGAPPCADVEGAVHYGVHAGVRAGEQE